MGHIFRTASSNGRIYVYDSDGTRKREEGEKTGAVKRGRVWRRQRGVCKAPLAAIGLRSEVRLFGVGGRQ